jgi:hypothetical protein
VRPPALRIVSFHSANSISTECATRHWMKRRIVEAGLADHHVWQQREPYS